MVTTRHTGKIACVGFPKTGTSTIVKALRVLGYDIAHWHDVIGTEKEAQAGQDIGNGHGPQTLLNEYDGVADVFGSVYFREVLRLHRDARFILTTRDVDNWAESLVQHVWRTPMPEPGTLAWGLRWATWGCLLPTPGCACLRKISHEGAVMELVPPEQLLVLDVSEGDGWENLCGFLGCEVPDEPFPHENKRPQ